MLLIKNAFQWDAYRPLVDRIPACTVVRGCTCLGGNCPRGCTCWGVYLPGGTCLGGVYLPGGCTCRGVPAKRGVLARGAYLLGGGGCTCLGVVSAGGCTYQGVYLPGGYLTGEYLHRYSFHPVDRHARFIHTVCMRRIQ